MSADRDPKSIASSFFDHVARRDPKIIDLYADDAMLITPEGRTMRGKTELESFFAEIFERGPKPSIKEVISDGGKVAIRVEALLDDGRTSRAVDVFDVGENGIRSQLIYRQIPPAATSD